MECDAPRVVIGADGFTQKILGRNNGAPHCPQVSGLVNLDSAGNFASHGGPHFIAVDHESRRVAAANYFVQLTPFGLPGTQIAGDDRVCMAWLTPTGELIRDDRFKDELNGSALRRVRQTAQLFLAEPRYYRSRKAAHAGVYRPSFKREGMRGVAMLEKHSTKIVDAVLLLVSAIIVLVIAWAESSLPAEGGSGPDFGLNGPGNRTYARASFPPDTVLVIYFGFTTCWRACPTALNAIAKAVEDLGEAGNRVQPIFVSLDPQREDPETVELYLKGFGDRFIGLRGSEDKVRAAASEFGVSVQRVRYSADPTDYTMVHSSSIIVLAPRKPDPIVVKPDSSAEEIRAVLVGVLARRRVIALPDDPW